ncbi:PAS domain-containing protein [Jannaschia aquimarina]|uniref:PAS fold protein n=1 Tax=Jannaschia aquimarina TaxID=935700 RepID=A0A0D1DAZ4_9RHOB|nr:PAS domain-containing protein [Jannaschia aquimarina]KIT17113.1 PAS fold protein [Jannaschia aquimarina]SNS47117.1 PAS domain-containing protein [Jannaschia aquimarina]
MKSSIADQAAQPQLDAEILRAIVDASRDACWCMEFGRPVDVTAPDAEVVRQVFENAPRWSLANRAMHELYMLPAGESLLDRPVSEIFPRNPQNEAFVLNLLANGFEVDAAPALDTRYDGEPIYVENDVRAHVEGGRLIRMFGTVRDVGKHRRRADLLERRLSEAAALWSALPVAALSVDGQGRIAQSNPAAARILGRDPVGSDLVEALDALSLGEVARAALDAAVPGGPAARRTAPGWIIEAAAAPHGEAVLTLLPEGGA